MSYRFLHTVYFVSQSYFSTNKLDLFRVLERSSDATSLRSFGDGMGVKDAFSGYERVSQSVSTTYLCHILRLRKVQTVQ